MDLDIAGLVVQGLLYGIGGMFVAIWDAALQNPWMFLIPAGLLGLAVTGSRAQVPARRRRYGYR